MNNTSAKDTSPPSRLALLAGVMLYMLAPLGMTIIPLVVGGSADKLGLSDADAGLLASADLIGLSISSVFAVLLLARVSWRLIACAGVMFIVAGNAGSFFVDGFTSLAIARFVTEIGSGLIYTVSLLLLGGTKNPDRYFSMGVGATIALSTVVFVTLPDIIAVKGVSPLFFVHGAVALIITPLLIFLPHNAQAKPEDDGPGGGSYLPLIVCFVAIGSLFVAEGSLWSYIERIGNRAEFAPAFIGNTLALSQVASLVAAIIAGFLSVRLGRLRPLIFVTFAFSASLFLIQSNSPTLYVVGTCLSQFAFIFSIPFLLRISVELDPSNRFFAFSIAFQMGGFALGPAIASLFIVQSGLQAITWIGAAAATITLILIGPLAYRLDRSKA